jgi:hypothetical protein
MDIPTFSLPSVHFGIVDLAALVCAKRRGEHAETFRAFP